MSKAITVAAAAIVLAAPTAAVAHGPNNTCDDGNLLTAYSANWHAVAETHGKRAPGRNIRAWGLSDRRKASCRHIRRSLAVLRRMRFPGAAMLTTAPPLVPPAQTSTLRATGYPLAAIRQCESGGNYATDTGNGFYGAYQFTLGTWASVGGAGNPAAASPAEQDKRAAMLYASRGAQPWPVCGR